MSDEILLQAAWVAPMTGPPIPDAGIVIQKGRILAVGSIKSLRNSWPDAAVHDAGNAIILPGLVNAHTHLELSLVPRGHPPARFVDWILGVMSQPVSPDGMQAGIDQCRRFGVTSVGDITSQPAITRPILARSQLHGISYGEVRGMAKRREFVEPRLTAAANQIDSILIRPGITPHAPYSIESDGYQRCLHIAKQQQLPLTTHLAETLDETTFLADHSGPFKQLWDVLNAWGHDVPRFSGGPIRFAEQIGLLSYPTLLAHVNYCDDDELNLLGQSKASVAYCPRTHHFFGHPPHRWREMLARGINVCVGTDSCASSLDLNLVDDLRMLHHLAPEMEPIAIWRMATTRAASALSLTDAGCLAPGTIANAAIFLVKTCNPLLEILETDVQPNELWINGISQRRV